MTAATVRPARSSRSFIAGTVERLVALCALLPYALVALAVRLAMTRVFFLSGQAKIEGPQFPIRWHMIDLTITLPQQVNDSVLQVFETQYANLPIPPAVAANLFAYAEFVLPICLVLGFATRFAALALVLITVLLRIYIEPQMWWSTHVYWILLLVVLVSLGPGAVSIDALIRTLHARDQAPAFR